MAADPTVDAVLAAPGNPGINLVAQCLPDCGPVTDPAAMSKLAEDVGADLVIVGPEAPLVAGVADAVRARGIACFGPSAAAAALEGSKAFAKEVMAAAGVPTALAHVCTSEDEVVAALQATGSPFVVKDDGLAAGKGVVVTDDHDEALAHGLACLAKDDGRVVIEEFLDGPEISLFCISDGTEVRALAPAQDFKRIGDLDTGPNTGGMGAYSPLPWAPDGLVEEVLERIAQPTIDEMRRRGTPFAGVLYVGLALTSRGLRVVEFNARFGDPETQVVLARLRTPLAQLLDAAAHGRLAELPELSWHDLAAVTVVLACEGYPQTPVVGAAISGLEECGALEHVQVLHAGTADTPEGVVASGGRVLSVVGTGPDLTTAREHAYAGVAAIDLVGGQHRTDIAQRAAEGTVLT
nr:MULTISPECIES: phosphoribosylamine--glycine ligase [unclassified Ornithinimicrobium]